MTLVADKPEPAISQRIMGKIVHEILAPHFRLSWLDKGLHDAPEGASAQAFMRTRDFKHLGGAIAWGRRRIFHGEVFGDASELVRVDRKRVNGVFEEYVDDDAQDITLAGFLPWNRKRDWGGGRDQVVLSSPERRCTFS